MSNIADGQHVDSSGPVLKRHTGACKQHKDEASCDDEPLEFD